MARYNRRDGGSNDAGSSGRPVSGVFGDGFVKFFTDPLTNFKAPASIMRVRMWQPAYRATTTGGSDGFTRSSEHFAGSFAMGTVRGVPINSNIPVIILNPPGMAAFSRVMVEFGNYLGITAGRETVGSVTPDVFYLGGKGYGSGAASLFGNGAGDSFFPPGAATGSPGVATGGAGHGGSMPATTAGSAVNYPTSGFTGEAAKMLYSGEYQVTSGGGATTTVRDIKFTDAGFGQPGIDYIGTGGGGEFAGANGGGTYRGPAGFPGGQCFSSDNTRLGTPAGGLVIVEW